MGATLFKLTTGESPLQITEGASKWQRLAELARGELPSRSQYDSLFPVELRCIVDRMLAADRAERFDTPQDVVDALQPFCDSKMLADFATRVQPVEIEVINNLSGQETVIVNQEMNSTSQILRGEITRERQPHVDIHTERGQANAAGETCESSPASDLRISASNLQTPGLSGGGRGRKWIAIAGLLLATFVATDLLGLTTCAATVVSIVRGDGTVEVEVYDPTLAVTVENNRVTISDQGKGSVQIPPGTYTVVLSRSNEPLDLRVVTLNRYGRVTVRFTFTPDHPKVTKEPDDSDIASNFDEFANAWSPPEKLSLCRNEAVLYGRPAISGDGLILDYESNASSLNLPV